MGDEKMDKEQPVFGFLNIPNRSQKPRAQGITTISDNSVPIVSLRGILEVAGDIIDYAKITDHAGLIYKYSSKLLKERIELYKSYDIKVLPGGSLFELAFVQHKTEMFFNSVKQVGFSAVEISECVMPPIDAQKRAELIKEAKQENLKVFTEVGRKSPTEPFKVEKLAREIEFDLKCGSEKVTVEESEILLINDQPNKLQELVLLFGLEYLMFEARDPKMQAWLINTLGPDVNIENITLFSHEPVITLERMRRKLHRLIGYEFIS